jgi:hypothetical protein
MEAAEQRAERSGDAADKAESDEETMTDFGQQCSWLDLDSTLPDTEIYARERLKIMSGLSLTLGSRFLRRTASESDGEDSQGISGEAALQYIAQGWPLGTSFFLSGSILQFGTANDKAGSVPAIFPSFRDLRAAGGVEVRSASRVAGAMAIPRIGLLGSASQARWTNDFAFGKANAKVRGYQYEVALYMSGHFLGGFSGLVSFGVLKPYGSQEKLQYIVSLAPSIGAPLSTSKTDGGTGDTTGGGK